MRVDYPVTLGGKNIVISKECESDTAVFKFLHHMDELYGSCVCERNGKSSDKTKISIRQTKDGDLYYEMACYDPSVPDCHFAKRHFGVIKKPEDGNDLFPKNKDEDGNWKPWVKFNKETNKEE